MDQNVTYVNFQPNCVTLTSTDSRDQERYMQIQSRYCLLQFYPKMSNFEEVIKNN